MVRRWNLLAVCLCAGVLPTTGVARGADNLVFVPLAPCRVIDTRVSGAGGALVAGTPRTFFVRGPTRDYATTPNQGGSPTGCGIPDLTSDVSPFQNIAKAVAINIVAVGPAGAGDLRAWPANQTAPNASVINYAVDPGPLNIANGVIVPMCDEVTATPCSTGDITFRADVSGTQLVVDVVGYFHAGWTSVTLSNTALGHQALAATTSGANNTATGFEAMGSNTTGNANTVIGWRALRYNSTGSFNVAIGGDAMVANNAGSENTAVGTDALFLSNSAVGRNTAVGTNALRSNSVGSGNTAVGRYALFNSTGSYNISLGAGAGTALVTGNGNILVGNAGQATESDTVRIGTAQTRAFVAGVRGVTTGNNDAVAVLVDSNGQLGTVSSSIRFKEDVRDLGAAADRVLDLRPVSFRYRKPFANGEKPVQYGLIAEEVEKVLPELVAYGKDGRPETVKYQVLPTLLLAELEKEHARLAEQDRRLAEKDAQVSALSEEVRALRARLEAVERRAAPR